MEIELQVLKILTAKMLGVTVQEGEHSSVQDAQATMRLYTMFMMGNEENQKIKKNAEHRFAGNQKVPTLKNEESKNSNGPEQ